MRNHHVANTAYPIAHRRTIWPYRRPASDHESLLRRDFGGSDPCCLYAHIPFCQSRCSFCEYCVVDRHDDTREQLYHHALLRELDLLVDRLGLRDKPLAGFDIGGGTPSLVAPDRIEQLVKRVTGTFRLEAGFGISIETTPRVAALQPERIAALHAMGIDRISMGLQMVNSRLLRLYGRDLNDVGYNRAAVESIRSAGFRRFNIDVMYGLAQQSPEDFLETLQATVRLEPDIITLYRMRYKGTRIEQESSDVALDRVTQLYELARTALAGAGYHANPGKNAFSRDPADPGTSPYLTRRVVDGMPYLGLGLGSQTFSGALLAYNLGAASKRLEPYLQAVDAGRLPIQDLYDLPAREGMAKMLAVSFYFGEIDLDAFRRRFGVPLHVVFPNEVAFVLRKGLMQPRGRKLRLTEQGAKAFPGVIALFYADSVKAYLHELKA